MYKIEHINKLADIFKRKMTTYLFSDEELSHLKFIRENSPIRIWYEYIQYVFEYENFYFTLKVELAEKIYQAKEFEVQYAMKTEIKFIEDKFVAQQGSQLLSENEKITEIEIVRTKLYFAKYRQITESYNESDSSQINPNKSLPTNIEIEKAIIVDVGISATLENNRILNLFVNDNDDDFTSNDFNYREGNFYEELCSKYQFIALN